MPHTGVYVAAPVAVLLRPDWPDRVRHIQGLVGPIWDPAVLFGSSAEWLDGWPELVPMVGGLVLVPDDDGSIGAGCLREIADVFGRDRPVWLYEGVQLVPWADVLVSTVPMPSRFRVATVRARAVVREPGRRTRAKKETPQ